MATASGVQCRTASAHGKFPPSSADTPSTSNSPADNAVLTHTIPTLLLSQPAFQHKAALCAAHGRKTRKLIFFGEEKNKNKQAKKHPFDKQINRTILVHVSTSTITFFHLSAFIRRELLDSEQFFVRAWGHFFL